MDIKDLNKVQLILLALLLSFVTSIATGITTVSLMQQAPSSVTVPINRVVRETVEKIVPVEGKTTVQTVVVKEEDLVVDAIQKNKSALFTVTKEIEGQDAEVGAGKGVAISDKDIIVVDGVLVPEKGNYFVKNESGKFKADFLASDAAGFSFLKIGAPLDEKSKVSYTVPILGDISKMKAGQKILILGDAISSFIFEGNKEIKLTVTQSSAGGLVLNLDGEALGIALLSEGKTFAPIDVIMKSAEAVLTP